MIPKVRKSVNNKNKAVIQLDNNIDNNIKLDLAIPIINNSINNDANIEQVTIANKINNNNVTNDDLAIPKVTKTKKFLKKKK